MTQITYVESYLLYLATAKWGIRCVNVTFMQLDVIIVVIYYHLVVCQIFNFIFLLP
jgi:hypothetical protein